MREGFKFADKFEAKADPPPTTLDEVVAKVAEETAKENPLTPFDPTPGTQVTLAQHLARGKEMNQERQRQDHAANQRMKDAVYRHWHTLMNAAADQLGAELLSTIDPPRMPETFTIDTESVSLTFRPFNRSTLFVSFACCLEKKENHARKYSEPWHIPTSSVNPPFTVTQDWRPNSNGVNPGGFVKVATASEAVHLCYEQGVGWDDASRRYKQMKARDEAEVSKR